MSTIHTSILDISAAGRPPTNEFDSFCQHELSIDRIFQAHGVTIQVRKGQSAAKPSLNGSKSSGTFEKYFT